MQTPSSRCRTVVLTCPAKLPCTVPLSGIGLQPQKIHLQPVESDNDKAPNYRVILDDMEIGAAFERENKRGEYTLVVIDSPALAAPIFSYLRKNVKAGYTLEWERQRRKDRKDAE